MSLGESDGYRSSVFKQKRMFFVRIVFLPIFRRSNGTYASKICGHELVDSPTDLEETVHLVRRSFSPRPHNWCSCHDCLKSNILDVAAGLFSRSLLTKS